jgi:hypothetical protein
MKTPPTSSIRPTPAALSVFRAVHSAPDHRGETGNGDDGPLRKQLVVTCGRELASGAWGKPAANGRRLRRSGLRGCRLHP